MLTVRGATLPLKLSVSVMRERKTSTQVSPRRKTERWSPCAPTACARLSLVLYSTQAPAPPVASAMRSSSVGRGVLLRGSLSAGLRAAADEAA